MVDSIYQGVTPPHTKQRKTVTLGFPSKDALLSVALALLVCFIAHCREACEGCYRKDGLPQGDREGLLLQVFRSHIDFSQLHDLTGTTHT